MMPWTDEKALRQQVKKLWDRGILLSALEGERLADEPQFPRRLQFKAPSSRELSEQFDAVRQWIGFLQRINGIRIDYRLVRHRVLGENRVPHAAWLDSPDDGVRMLGKQTELRQFSGLVALARERAPVLLGWVQRYPLRALALVDVWARLLDFIEWLLAHPQPGIYLRQVDVPGIDSKFIEQHRAALAPLLDLVLPDDTIDQRFTGVIGFTRRYGFLSKPLMVRFRVLDSALSLLPGSDRDITLTDHDFRELYQQPSFVARLQTVFITENEINFLAFPPRENSLVIFGAGYGFDALAQAPWLMQVRVVYWGDIDTHGFIILDQLRGRLPHARSLLMDQQTLLAHRPFWGQERQPEQRSLTRLDAAEGQLYRDLCSNRFAVNLRLEQERVSFDSLGHGIDSILLEPKLRT